MAASPGPTDEERTGLALAGFLRASGPAETARCLAYIVDEVAMPVIARVLARKLAPGGGKKEEVEEVASRAKEQLLERLLNLRTATAGAPAGPADGRTPIRDLTAYAASLAYAAWARHLSSVQPGRAILGNRLRHLLEDRHGSRGFACWQGTTGERWCGFAAWHEPGSPDRQGNPHSSARLCRLTAEPMAAAREALGDSGDPRSCELEVLLKKLFLWVGAPVEWHDLSAAVFQICQAHWKTVAENADEAAGTLPDAGPTPHDQLHWKESLQWLWRQVEELPPRQRAAYLLHTHAVFEWEAAGIASVGDVADRLGLPREGLAGLWGRLPLDDLTIAEMLACTRQQVINLRRVARDTLGRAWQQWSATEAGLTPMPARSGRVISRAFSTLF